jgi:AraC family transcriptional regulator of adaptative response/methylated-DNA-[protein]-cysteine methyltransferase
MPDMKGVFIFFGVRKTGIFCRPIGPGKKPRRDNVVFFAAAGDAIAAGYRPCKRCRPLHPAGRTPETVRQVLECLDASPAVWLRDADLRAINVEPSAVRRWFKAHHGITFHSFQRCRG